MPVPLYSISKDFLFLKVLFIIWICVSIKTANNQLWMVATQEKMSSEEVRQRIPEDGSLLMGRQVSWSWGQVTPGGAYWRQTEANWQCKEPEFLLSAAEAGAGPTLPSITLRLQPGHSDSQQGHSERDQVQVPGEGQEERFRTEVGLADKWKTKRGPLLASTLTSDNFLTCILWSSRWVFSLTFVSLRCVLDPILQLRKLKPFLGLRKTSLMSQLALVSPSCELFL